MPEQQFTKGKIYTIEVDDGVISPNECSSFCAGLDAPFFENMNSDVSLEQFRKMAWADSVWMKSDHLPIEIPYNARQKWKLLWKYFDLKKSMDSKN